MVNHTFLATQLRTTKPRSAASFRPWKPIRWGPSASRAHA